MVRTAAEVPGGSYCTSQEPDDGGAGERGGSGSGERWSEAGCGLAALLSWIGGGVGREEGIRVVCKIRALRD